jgi:ABC-type sugar transport system substrate-binding protein
VTSIIRRRDLILAFAAAAGAWPLGARAQQRMPVIGYLQSASPGYFAQFAGAVREGLRENGYIEGQNVTIEFRSAEGHYERLAALVANLIERRVDVIFAAGGSDPAKAAKAATSSIPIVFITAADPVSGRRLSRADSQGREAGRAAGGAADQVRARHQSQDREAARARRAGPAARARRRGDRMSCAPCDPASNDDHQIGGVLNSSP